VQLNGGYYDLATPYFAAEYELHQLPIQSTLQGNIEMHFYTSSVYRQDQERERDRQPSCPPSF